MVLPLVGYRSPLPGGGRASLLAADLCVGILDISCVFVALSLCFVPHEPGSGPTLGFRMSLASSFEVASGGLHVGSRCQSWPERLIHGQAGGGGVWALNTAAEGTSPTPHGTGTNIMYHCTKTPKMKKKVMILITGEVSMAL